MGDLELERQRCRAGPGHGIERKISERDSKRSKRWLEQKRQTGICTPSIGEGGSLRDEERDTRQREAEIRMNRDMETENSNTWRQSEILTH